jgi:hypothetical protein
VPVVVAVEIDEGLEVLEPFSEPGIVFAVFAYEKGGVLRQARLCMLALRTSSAI